MNQENYRKRSYYQWLFGNLKDAKHQPSNKVSSPYQVFSTLSIIVIYIVLNFPHITLYNMTYWFVTYNGVVMFQRMVLILHQHMFIGPYFKIYLKMPFFAE